MRLVCALGVFLALLQLSSSLLLGAFNIKSFGEPKASDDKKMNIISTIVHRYDIILIQEVIGKKLFATEKLMEHVNKGSPQFTYNCIFSEPLGADTYTERYLFLYRERTVSVDDSYTYNNVDDKGKRIFSREPFIVMFSSQQTAVRNFALIPQHTSPKKAVTEINALFDVVTDVRTRWNTNNIVLLGDFNAGGGYVKDSQWQEIRLFTDNSFHWLITNDAVTSVSGTNCPYDRIVVTEEMMRGVVDGSARVYNFASLLEPKMELLDISDHFPVEVELIDQPGAAAAAAASNS